MGIFDDIVQGVSNEIAKVQARSQEMLQAYNLSSQIRTLESKKNSTLLEIGKLVFDKYQHNAEVSEDELKEKSRQIGDLDHEISVLQAELSAVQAQSDPNVSASQKSEFKAGYSPTPGFNCPHCSAPANTEKTFCPACGGALKTPNGTGSGTGNGGGS